MINGKRRDLLEILRANKTKKEIHKIAFWLEIW